MKPIELDITKMLDKYNKLHSSMPYLISKSMNDVAFKHGREDLSNEMKDVLTNRNKYFSSPNAIKVKKSSKNDLEVTLYHFKEELRLQQEGGIETPKGKKLAIPVRKNLQKYAGVPNNKAIPKSLSINTLMDKAPTHRGQEMYKTRGIMPFILRSGIFIRVGDGLRMIYSFADQAKHKKRLLKMQATIEKTYNDNFEAIFEKNFQKELS